MHNKKALVHSLLILAAICFIDSCAKPGPATKNHEDLSKDFAFAGKPNSPIVFLSTQMNPVEEAGRMRNAILKGFPGQVDFRPNDNSYLSQQVDTLLKTDPSQSILICALHGDLVTLHEQDLLLPLNTVFPSIGEGLFPAAFVGLSELDGRNSFYVPWMQASFVMVANKKALAFLPNGANLDELTYDQLFQWAENISKKKGIKALGFPVGEKGLMHRFFQGFLYPSYTGSTVMRFRSIDARSMWAFFRGLWQLTDPGSLVYSTMAEPLLTEDVWIAWDHTARLVKAFEERPEDFVAFPAPVGPKGRGYMTVISGLAIPRGVVDAESPAMLMDYLTRPAIQLRTLRETGFFPVVSLGADSSLPSHLKALVAAVDRQTSSKFSVPTLMPMGLGERGADYNSLFLLTFSEIVLDGKDIGAVLDEYAVELQKIITDRNAGSWLPDRSDERPFAIE